EALALLLGYFSSQRSAARKIFEEIRLTEPESREKTSHLAYLLHNLYCSLEDLFQEVAKTFENRVEDPSRYHRELLKRMCMEIPGIRPRLLSEAGFRVLDELRGFRHIFRHAYDYELSPAKTADLKNRTVGGWDAVQADLMIFANFLERGIRDNNLLP
ncbi:MAG: hypothetical protein HYU64_13870, partial [Armatimonadetes bacterium]|nr:hypothetical protein [Armatimonadota bacterium]